LIFYGVIYLKIKKKRNKQLNEIYVLLFLQLSQTAVLIGGDSRLFIVNNLQIRLYSRSFKKVEHSW